MYEHSDYYCGGRYLVPISYGKKWEILSLKVAGLLVWLKYCNDGYSKTHSVRQAAALPELICVMKENGFRHF